MARDSTLFALPDGPLLINPANENYRTKRESGWKVAVNLDYMEIVQRLTGITFVPPRNVSFFAMSQHEQSKNGGKHV